jgi:drug/metabolite transporter (DMT)-like permease
MTEVTYALAVFSSITYGAADFLGGLATKRSTTFSVVFFSQLAGLILVLLSLPFLPPSAPTTADFAWGAACGLAGGIGVALLYRGLAIGLMSVVAPVTAVCAVIIPVVVGVALGERPSGLAILGVFLAIAAIVLVSQTGHLEGGKRATTGVGIAIASGIAIGIFLVFLQRTGPSAVCGRSSPRASCRSPSSPWRAWCRGRASCRSASRCASSSAAVHWTCLPTSSICLLSGRGC